MRIGIISVIRESWGGSEELWAAMAHEAIGEGHEVIVSAYNCGDVHPKMQALINKGLKLVYRRGYVKPGLPTWKRIATKICLLLLNKITNPFSTFFKTNCDCIIYNGTSYSCLDDHLFFSTAIKKRLQYFHLSHLSSDYYRPFSNNDIPFIRSCLQHAKRNLFIAVQTSQVLERQLAYAIPNKILVRNPVNLINLTEINYPSIEGTINFATVGLLVTAHKGQDLLFETLSKDLWTSRNWILNVYGDGPDAKYLKDLALHFQIDKKIVFHGKVNDIRKIWEKNHILIMPSLMEGMPLAIVEAMLCSRPVLATDVGDHARWISHRREGFIAEGANSNSIAKTLEDAWNRQELWKELGKQARRKALEFYEVNPGEKLLKIVTEKN